MGRHSTIGPHYYDGLDTGDYRSVVKLELPLAELAFKINELNYGTQRFLSHLIDVRRARLKARIEAYGARGDSDDIAEHVQREGDPLADGIEALLKEGLY